MVLVGLSVEYIHSVGGAIGHVAVGQSCTAAHLLTLVRKLPHVLLVAMDVIIIDAIEKSAYPHAALPVDGSVADDAVMERFAPLRLLYGVL